MGSTNVRLPKQRSPTFPGRCVVCHRQDPAATVKIAAIGLSEWLVALITRIARRRSFYVHVPACAPCARRLQIRRYSVEVASNALYIFGAWLIVFVFNWSPWAIVGGIVFGGLVALLKYELFPPAIELSVRLKTVLYRFSNRDYADEFATANVDST